ncbi:transglycosylase SLT domain-containing protein [Microbulbifer sp. 2201CG32-9]|uniref:transglycosylase SLT domain-containing protein n=1 Tax=Microbulbifer sp. 2201CG32-9 TaxID=3232309 RepID=UPI00345BA1F8
MFSGSHRIALLYLLMVAAAHSDAAPSETGTAATQREQLAAARAAIAGGDQGSYRKLRAQLQDYPLRPYLDYWSITRRIHRLPLAEIDTFLTDNRDTAIGDWMRVRLLRELGARKRFRAYLKYYQPDTVKRASLQCYYADALARHGDKDQAYGLVQELWMVGHSQTEECDPVFARWIADGGLTPALNWKRHKLAVEEKNLELAAFIARRMDSAQGARAQLMRQVHRQPELLLDYQRFSTGQPEDRDIVLLGLHRLARTDAEQADRAWGRYEASFLFSAAERNDLLRDLALRYAQQEDLQGLQQFMQRHDDIADARTTTWLARQALRRLDWEQVNFWIDRLPQETQEQERWLYWKARAVRELYGQRGAEVAKHLYQKAAAERSYYGFLAADAIGNNYRFIDRPVPVTPVQVAEMARRPALLRARELQAIGEFYHARREWEYATRNMSPQELLAAGKVASTWGWYHKSIQSVLAADYLDDLELRFPLAFADIVGEVSKKSPLDPNLIYAVARQESHFSRDAKSSAGALGLMQLLPSTARDTARRAGVPYRRSWDLLSPSTNIALGSFYLGSLLHRFDNNRILATAAYNAGPARVARWLRETQHRLPYDVWIETIPFQETRKYVQNVLAYTVIYAYRSGAAQPLVRDHEAAAKL